MQTCMISSMKEDSNTYTDAPARVYTIKPTETQLGHNKKTKEALTLLAKQPKIAEWARVNALASLRNVLEETITQEAWNLSNALLNNYGVQLCPEVASVWICDQLEKHIGATTEWHAGFAYESGDSKANLARAVGIKQQNCMTHFPQLEEIAAAQTKADETGQPQTIVLRGDEFDVYPSKPHEE